MPEIPAQIEAVENAAVETAQQPAAPSGESAAVTAVEAAGADKRRSPRLARQIAVHVFGVDTLGQQFREAVKTSSISCYGCKYPSVNYAPKGSIIGIEIAPDALHPITRVVRGRVVWVQRPRNHRELYQVAMEFEVPGNVWGIPDPPADWFPHPDDVKPEPAAKPQAVEVSAAEAGPGQSVAGAMENPHAAEFDEQVFTREELDGEIAEAVARTVKLLAERIAESAVEDFVRDASARATATIEKARKDGRAAAEALDARIRQALDEALADSQPASPPGPASSRRAPTQRRKRAAKPRRRK